MTPRYSFADAIYGALGDAIVRGLAPCRNPAFADRQYIRVGKLGSPGIDSSGGPFWMDLHAAHSSALCVPIGHIVCACSEEEMFGVDAERSVATVQHPRSFGDGSEVEKPRCAMGSDLLSVEMEGTITAPGARSAPEPASIRSEDNSLCHEGLDSFCGRLSDSHVAPPMRKVRGGEGLNSLSTPKL